MFGGSATGIFASPPKIGTVVYANDPRNQGTTPLADIGVVEFATGVAFQPPRALRGTARAAANSQVTIHARTHHTAVIMGYCSYVFLPAINGTYGDTYFTTTNITSGGDSGSAAYCGSCVIGL